MLSYDRGPEIPLLEKTIPQVVRETVQRYPDQEAIVSRHQNIRYTWRQVEEEAHRVAQGLRGLGMEYGDRVGIWSTNCVEWFLLQLASAEAGVVLVNVNPAYRSYELSYVLRQSRIRGLFLREKDNRANYLEILAESRNGDSLPLEKVVVLGTGDWDRMLAGGVELGDAEVQPEDVANIQYTSGTTGSPKGVMLTHRNLVNNGAGIGWCLKASGQDRICLPVPFYHCFGCVIGSMVSITSGAALILPAPQFDPLATMRAIHEERATAVYGVPTMFISELEHPEFRSFDFSSMRTGVMAGSPCPIEVMKRVMTEMHCPEITICYGQTELSPVVTMPRVDDSVELRVQTIGCAMPNTEIKVISPETLETLPVGQIGELCARGYMVMKGYDGMEEATRQVVDDEGWLRTGDLAIMQENGYFRMRGRAKDTIIRGGENIYPREVEEFLHTHPKVADVYVFGLPDERLGETVCAWIKLKTGETATEDEIREYCRGRVAYFKVPHYIRMVDNFPLTVTNKVQKFLMREREIEHRGLQQAARVATA